MIDGSEPDWANRYKAIRHEMDSYGGNLTKKPEIVVINKIDTLDEEEMYERLSAFEKSFGRRKKPAIVMISAAGRIGIDKLISTIEKQIKETENV